MAFFFTEKQVVEAARWRLRADNGRPPTHCFRPDRRHRPRPSAQQAAFTRQRQARSGGRMPSAMSHQSPDMARSIFDKLAGKL